MKKLLYMLLFVPVLGVSQNVSWQQIGQDIDGEAGGDRSGEVVAINSNGNIIAIGAYGNDGNGNDAGHVRVYEDISGNWVQIGEDIDGDTGNFGYSVSLSGDGYTLAVGSSSPNTEVKVYSWNGTIWIQKGQTISGYLNASLVSLSANGDTMAISSSLTYNDSTNNGGPLRVFVFDGTNWIQIGGNMNGISPGDDFGYSVSISNDGSVVAAGAPWNDLNGIDAGCVRVFYFDGVHWFQLGSDIIGEAAEDNFGWSVSLNDNGTKIAIGAPDNDGGGIDFGHVRVYEIISGNWVQIGQDIDGLGSQSRTGWSVSLSDDGNRLSVGYPAGGSNGGGFTKIYENVLGNWLQIGEEINGTNYGENFGYSQALNSNGNIVCVGAWAAGVNNNSFTGTVRVYRYGGCTNIAASNYDSSVLIDDGSCLFPGCTDNTAVNYDSLANDDDGSCISQEEYTIDSLNNAVEQAINSMSSLQQALDTWNTSIDLSAGWNMFGYGCPSSIDVADGLSNHTESIIITKDNNGNVYMPEFGFNGIGDFTPGFGYQIKVTDAIEGFSLCDWYVNNIPEDNIVSLQDSLEILNSEILDLECVNQGACFFNVELNGCEYPNEGLFCNGDSIPYVGMLAYGGVVFYVDESSQHGLVVSTEDINTIPSEAILNTDYSILEYGVEYKWGCNFYGPYNEALGSGYPNSLEIDSVCGLLNPNSINAAHLALNFESQGYSDWYLPSKEEFLLISNVSFDSELGNIANITDNADYWSSSSCCGGDGFSHAYLTDQNFSSLSYTGRDTHNSIRPIRSF